jgi:hypothetical protein
MIDNTINRRAILAGAASAPVAMPAAALPMPDPIYAAIEEHRRAHAAAGALLDAATDDWESEADAAMDAYWAAADALFDTNPTTVAGVAALLRYAYEFEMSHPEEFCGHHHTDRWAYELHGRAAEMLEALGVA